MGEHVAVVGELDHEVEVALPLEDLADRATLGRRLDGILDVLHVDAVAGGRRAVYHDLELRLPHELVIVQIRYPADGGEDGGDLLRLLLQHEEIGTEELDAELALHSGQRLVHVVLDRLGEVCGDAGQVGQGRAHGLDELVLLVESPLLARLQPDVELVVVCAVGIGAVINEFYIGLKPREQWRFHEKNKLIEAMAASLSDLPGITTNFSQPIKDNVDEALAGVKGELSIKLFGPDLFVLQRKAKEIAGVLASIRGVTDLDYDQLVGQPQLQIVVDRSAAARYGINVQDIQDAIEAATKGRTVSEIFEGERRFNLVVKLTQDGDMMAHLRNLLISAPSGERIPLTQLAEFTKTEGFGQILRDGNVRRVAIKWSVRDRDMGGLVAEAMKKVESAVKLPSGYEMVWSGRFEDQQRALARLYIIVPLVVFIIFVLLFAAFNSVGDALLIMLNLPFALIGGTVALFLWQTNFNISAAV